MTGIITKVNYRRSLAIFEDENGDYGYFEMLGRDDLEVDDKIMGNLHILGETTIIKRRTNERYKVIIEDYGMYLTIAMMRCFG